LGRTGVARGSFWLGLVRKFISSTPCEGLQSKSTSKESLSPQKSAPHRQFVGMDQCGLYCETLVDEKKTLSGIRKIRCVLVHDHVLLRQGLRRLLEDAPDIEVVSEAGSAPEALHSVFEHRPEVVIADAGVFELGPEQAERLILEESPRSKVLFLTMQEDQPFLRNGRLYGTSCAVRQTSAQELVEAVRKIHTPRNVVREIPRKNPNRWAEGFLPHSRGLTAREREVLKLLAEGMTVRSAAAALGLSVKTVDAHKFNLMRKLGVHNKAELVMWAIQQKVVKVPVSF
jgi:two-component system, NarL family, response regulator NreC